jgi:ABC-type transport system involved in cytochrome bd biosynthesis fused ATPase/permease subunit
VKVVNNLLTNFSRFLIFALGGYLALEGQLALGALVAFISAQEKLYDPWKELIAFYQAYQTATVTYARTRDFFDYQTDSGLRSGKKDIDRLEGRIEVDGLSFQTMEGTTLLQDVSFTLQPGQHMALVGGSGSGKSTLINCLMGLQPIADGRYDLDGRRLSDYSRRDLSANMGFVFQDPVIFTGSLEENLLYACQARAKSAKDEGAPDLPDLNNRIEMLQQTDLFSDVLGFGLAARFDPAVHKHLRESVLALRREFRDKSASAAEAEHIEIYAPQRFLRHASVAENLLFGRVTSIGPSIEDLPGDSFFAGFLRQEKLWAALLELGAQLAEDLIEKRDHRFIPTQRMPVAWEELAFFRKRRQKSKSRRPRDPSEQQQRFLISMALRYIPAVHQLTEIPKDLRRRIVACRSPLKRALQRALPAAVRFYHPQAYIEDASIQANIRFGRITTRDSEVVARINTRINRLLVEEELLEAILAIGMQYQVGSGGEKLSGGQRQKLALARSLLKQPSILLLDEATASLDNKSQDRVQKVLAARWKGNNTLVAVVHRLDIIKDYDQIAVMESGRIAEMGAYDELMVRKGRLYQLVQKQHSA